MTMTTKPNSSPEKFKYERNVFGTFIALFIVIFGSIGLIFFTYFASLMFPIREECIRILQDGSLNANQKILKSFIFLVSECAGDEFSSVFSRTFQVPIEINNTHVEAFINVLSASKAYIFFMIFSMATNITVTSLKMFRYFMINPKIRYSLSIFCFCLDTTTQIILFGNPIAIVGISIIYIFSFLPLTSCWAIWFYPIYAVPITPMHAQTFNNMDPEMQKYQNQQQQQYQNVGKN